MRYSRNAFLNHFKGCPEDFPYAYNNGGFCCSEEPTESGIAGCDHAIRGANYCPAELVPCENHPSVTSQGNEILATSTSKIHIFRNSRKNYRVQV